MENASQALLIAGGILLAILTISLFVYMFSNISTFGNAQAKEKEVARIKAWNAEWEAYNKEYLYGADVQTVINKAKQSEYKVDILVNGGNAPDDIGGKNLIYKCTGVEYGGDGRVNKMSFEICIE